MQHNEEKLVIPICLPMAQPDNHEYTSVLDRELPVPPSPDFIYYRIPTSETQTPISIRLVLQLY